MPEQDILQNLEVRPLVVAKGHASAKADTGAKSFSPFVLGIASIAEGSAEDVAPVKLSGELRGSQTCTSKALMVILTTEGRQALLRQRVLRTADDARDAPGDLGELADVSLTAVKLRPGDLTDWGFVLCFHVL